MALKRERRTDPFAQPVKRFCSTVGCEQVAAVGSTRCEACDNRGRMERVRAANEARGLHSVDDMRAYCKRLLRARFLNAKPSFERWAENITQRTVDLIVTHGNDSDVRVLERLFAIGAIDENRKLVPLADRQARRDEIEAKQKAEQERIEAALKAQGVVRRPDIDTEAPA
jgi:hypothetical protein